MESLIRPMLTIEYEIARKMISALLIKGLISAEEFEAIDEENIKAFAEKPDKQCLANSGL
jgi:hypothetical protein